MLIDLETVATSPFRLREGFQYLREWSIEMLEQSIRMMAKNVCEALSVLHEAGLVQYE
jgi:N-acetylglucosamine-6-phosphate deacetylase